MIKLPDNKEEWSREDLLSYAIAQILKERGWKPHYGERIVRENEVHIKEKYKIKEGKFYEGVVEITRKGEDIVIRFTVRKREGFLKKLLGRDKYSVEFRERLGKFIDKAKRLKEKALRNLINTALSKLK